MVPTGMEASDHEDGRVPAPIEPPGTSVAGALPAELLQMLNGGPRTVNEDGELEELPPPEPATLAPAFSKETLEALRAERLARRAVAPPAGSARPSRPTSSPTPCDQPPAKAPKSHRSGSKSPPDSAASSKAGKGAPPLKSNRDGNNPKAKKVYLSMPKSQLSARPQVCV